MWRSNNAAIFMRGMQHLGPDPNTEDFHLKLQVSLLLETDQHAQRMIGPCARRLEAH